MWNDYCSAKGLPKVKKAEVTMNDLGLGVIRDKSEHGHPVGTTKLSQKSVQGFRQDSALYEVDASDQAALSLAKSMYDSGANLNRQKASADKDQGFDDFWDNDFLGGSVAKSSEVTKSPAAKTKSSGGGAKSPGSGSKSSAGRSQGQSFYISFAALLAFLFVVRHLLFASATRAFACF